MLNSKKKGLKKIILGIIISAIIGLISESIIKSIKKNTTPSTQTNTHTNTQTNTHTNTQTKNNAQNLIKNPSYKAIWQKINQICPNCTNKKELLNQIVTKYPSAVNTFKERFNNINQNEIENITKKISQSIPAKDILNKTINSSFWNSLPKL
jgi:uncharacterized membrane protein YraQ (UPF0718 family)